MPGERTISVMALTAEVCSRPEHVIVMAGGRGVGKTGTLAVWAFERAVEKQEGTPRPVRLTSHLGCRWWKMVMLPLLREMPWPDGTKITEERIELPSGVTVEPWYPPKSHAIAVDEAAYGPRWMFAGTPRRANLGWHKAYSALKYGRFSLEQIKEFKKQMGDTLFRQEFECIVEGKCDAG